MTDPPFVDSAAPQFQRTTASTGDPGTQSASDLYGNLSFVADWLQIAGFAVSAFTLFLAFLVRRAVKRERARLVKRIRMQELRQAISLDLRNLNRQITANDVESAESIITHLTADLEAMRPYATGLLSESLSQACDSCRVKGSNDSQIRRAELSKIRDAARGTLRLAEHAERELVWRDVDER